MKENAMPAKKPAKPKPSTRGIKPGDKVAWDSSGGESVGRVERKITSAVKIKGHTAKASKSNPEFLVRSDKSGKVAAHKPAELRKRK
jgi:hypothetical protein